ncbi:glycoside hydrolase family 88 protein [uncultured Cohaesibacter sp.]|uniref:glycoside hydrolase family 88/105 protein n=1 Tax=uncultured Cohaesibacter sp. TaxID=1002546 RepID=UPI0029C8DC7C|nr:glycoside hydrolase family 88 protein [uncultured Cohaesibacter sp.]
MLRSFFHQYVDRYSPYKGGPICYEDGCLYRGLISLYASTGEEGWIGYFKSFAEEQISPQGVIKGYVKDEYNIDNILSGRGFLHLYKLTGDERYLKTINQLADQLSTHPRTKGGNYWHKGRYQHQVWLDGLYMGLPFQIEYAQLKGDPALKRDAVDQLKGAIALMEIGQDGLLAHGYDEARQQAWCDPATGLSSSHWARSLGWVAMALIDVYDLVDEAEFGILKEKLISLYDRILALQTSYGAWLQVIDQPDLHGNYEESSATAMFAYSFLKATRLGFDDKYRKAGEKAMDYLRTQVASTPPDDRSLQHICCVAGLGGFDGVYRDGSPEYYISETVVSNDIKGVGPFMMAYGEALLSEQD